MKIKGEKVEIQEEVFVLGVWENLNKMSICGIFTNKLKLVEEYWRLAESVMRNYSPDAHRIPAIYRYNLNEPIGELSEWEDGLPDQKYKINIEEVQEQVEIYNDGCFQVFGNFNYGKAQPSVEIWYIGGPEDEIASVEAFLDTDIFKGEISDSFRKYILPVLKDFYNDNKEMLKFIMEEKKYIEISDWMEEKEK